MTGMLMFSFGLALAAFGVWAMHDSRRYYRKASDMFDEVTAMAAALEKDDAP